MVRKINVVDLNEIKPTNHQEATHAEEVTPIVEEIIITPEPAPEVEIPKVEASEVESKEEVVIKKVMLKLLVLSVIKL